MLNWVAENSLIIILGLSTIFNFLWLYNLRDRLKLTITEMVLIPILFTVYGVLSVTVFAYIEGIGDPSARGKMSLYGGIFFMPIFFWVWAKISKKKVSEVFDVLTIPLIFTLMWARVDCLITGCCYGNFIPGMSGLRWPTREMELVYYVIILFILGKKVLKRESEGEIYLLYMISYGLFRFITEFLRHSTFTFGVLHISHVWSIVTLFAGLSIYYEVARKNKKRRNK